MKYGITLSILFFLGLIFWLITLPQNRTFLASADEQRIVTLDWTVAETLLALDVPLAGLGDKKEYAVWVNSPTAADSVADLGLRSQPNLAVINTIKPNLLINATWLQNIIPQTSFPKNRIAIDFYTDKGINWTHAVKTTLALAKHVNKQDVAQEMVSRIHSDFQKNQHLLSDYQHVNYAIVQFIDSRHVRIYGENSLYGVVLTQLKLTNALTATANAWGYNQVALVELASLPENTILIVVQPHPANLYRKLEQNTLWKSLPFSQPTQHRVLPAVWGFGALPSMQRFNHLLTQALIKPENVW